MKNLKLVAISAVLIFAIASVSFAGDQKKELKTKSSVVQIDYDNAIRNPQLVADMRQQLDAGFMDIHRLVYRVDVLSQNVIYIITGTYWEWTSFFGLMFGTSKKYESFPIEGSN